MKVYANNVFVRLRTVKPSNLRMFSKSLVALVMTSPVPMVCTQPGSCSSIRSNNFCLNETSTCLPTPNTSCRDINLAPPITVAMSINHVDLFKTYENVNPSFRSSTIFLTSIGIATLRIFTKIRHKAPIISSLLCGLK